MNPKQKRPDQSSADVDNLDSLMDAGESYDDLSDDENKVVMDALNGKRTDADLEDNHDDDNQDDDHSDDDDGDGSDDRDQKDDDNDGDDGNHDDNGDDRDDDDDDSSGAVDEWFKGTKLSKQFESVDDMVERLPELNRYSTEAAQENAEMRRMLYKTFEAHQKNAQVPEKEIVYDPEKFIEDPQKFLDSLYLDKGGASEINRKINALAEMVGEMRLNDTTSKLENFDDFEDEVDKLLQNDAGLRNSPRAIENAYYIALGKKAANNKSANSDSRDSGSPRQKVKQSAKDKARSNGGKTKTNRAPKANKGGSRYKINSEGDAKKFMGLSISDMEKALGMTD